MQARIGEIRTFCVKRIGQIILKLISFISYNNVEIN